MTIHFYTWSITKRAEAIALLDSGATENFMNLGYTWWLCLPIKCLSQPQPLFNIVGSENKSGQLLFYTDLQVQTGQQTTNLRFFLSDLGKHKAILGYPWFAAFQPCIDWKRGWIDTTQLPIIFSTPNAKYIHRAQRHWPTQRDQYFIGWVTFQTPAAALPSKIPEEYQQHNKVFSEEQSQRLPSHSIWGSCNRIVTWSPKFTTGMTITPKPWRKGQNPQIHIRTPGPRNNSNLQISLHSRFLLCQEERWKTLASTRLLTPKQMDEEEQEYLPINKPGHQSS